jgi:hypothetical protein
VYRTSALPFYYLIPEFGSFGTSFVPTLSAICSILAKTYTLSQSARVQYLDSMTELVLAVLVGGTEFSLLP